jgi:hypothetical protein
VAPATTSDGSSGEAAAMSSSASSIPSGTGPSNTSTDVTFGISARMRANIGAVSASTKATVASQ